VIDMQVAEIMSQPVVVTNVTTTSREVARRMRDLHIGAMPVVPVNEADRPVGMVTDRDIVVRAVAENRLPSNAAISTIMSEGVYTCFDDDSDEEAARIMAEHQVRRLPVLNRDERLVGIVAIADLARSGAKEAEERALEGVSQPSDRPRR
jgi:CBS domain-containing protein